MEHVSTRSTRLARGGVLRLMAALGALAIVYAVGFDPTVHELMHDARHLLGIPCH